MERQEAKELGLKTYFTGRPCINGHTAERRTDDGNCVICNREHVRQYAKRNTEERNAYSRKWRRSQIENNPEFRDKEKERQQLAYRNKPLLGMLTSARAGAKKRGLSFDITLEDLQEVYTEVCPIFKTELFYGRGRNAGVKANSASLDRIDSSKGYIKGNIWIISWRANQIKNEGTVEEHRMIADVVEEKMMAT